MDHLDAEQMQAVERYVLGDLSVSQVEDFERHFFDCPQCSEELRTLTIFEENARAVFREQDLAAGPVIAPVPQSTARWWSGFSPPLFRQWQSVLAALILGILAGGWGGFRVFELRESVQAVSAYPLYAQARGEETFVSPAASSKFYTLYLDRTWDGDYISYSAVISNTAGTKTLTVPVNIGAAGDAIHMLIPTHKLDAGRYVLVMMGSGLNSQVDKQTELARFPFTLRFQ